MSRPQISACMIVKNEEKLLRQCLESIKNVVDEIIIVDTGSTDKTVEIAKDFTNKIYFHEWNNSFSEARNHSLGYATKEWILQIDADETFDSSSVNDLYLILEKLRSTEYESALVAIYSELPTGDSKHYFQRIFKRGRCHFEGIVHNQLITQHEPYPTEIKMRHYGYNLPSEDMMLKYKRTGDLLLKQLEHNPGDLFAIANLLRNYRNEGNYEECIRWGVRVLAMGNYPNNEAIKAQLQRICLDTAYAFSNLNLYFLSEPITHLIHKMNPEYLDNIFLMGNLALSKGAFENAIEIYEHFLNVQKNMIDGGAHYLIMDTHDFGNKVRENIQKCRNFIKERDSQKQSPVINKFVEQKPYQPKFKKKNKKKKRKR